MTAGLTRRVTKRARRTSFLVFVEGLRTEPIYLKHWERKHREHVVLTIDPFRGTPAALVERAVDAKAVAQREAKRGRGPAYDQVWCVFDVDEHPNVEAAIRRAADAGIAIAVSNPCIELWFLLHGIDQTAAIDRHAAQKASAATFGFDKSPAPKHLDALDADYETAMRRSRQLDDKHEKDGSRPGSNPSSALWRLIEAIRSAGS